MVENTCVQEGVWKSEVEVSTVWVNQLLRFASVRLRACRKMGKKCCFLHFFNSVIAESTKLQVSIFICNQFVSGGSSFETLDGSEDGTCC